MASLAMLNQAASDAALLARAAAAAAELGIPNATVWVAEHARELAASPVNDAGDTVVSVYDYAFQVRKAHLAAEVALPPGENPGAVTDDFLRAAVQHVRGSEVT